MKGIKVATIALSLVLSQASIAEAMNKAIAQALGYRMAQTACALLFEGEMTSTDHLLDKSMMITALKHPVEMAELFNLGSEHPLTQESFDTFGVVIAENCAKEYDQLMEKE